MGLKLNSVFREDDDGFYIQMSTSARRQRDFTDRE